MMEPTTLSMLQLNAKILLLNGCSGMTYQMHAPTMMAVFRPNMSERKPENKAEIHDPPAIEAVMPPCTLDVGPMH